MSPATADPNPRIGDVIEVAAVETVVRLDGRGGRLGELVLTGDVVQSMVAVLEAAGTPCGAGFFVVGHFGSGKSHFLAALGELLARPQGQASDEMAGWDPNLRKLAAAARSSLVVPVPLVEYRSRAALEDVVLARAWRARDRPAPGGSTGSAGSDRMGTWDGLLAAAQTDGRAGLVLLVDELSEFLRAKHGPALTEDLRFLQFLGEWAGRRPVVVICALQESIEEVANVSQRELARIRDRFQPSLTLSMRHVEDVVRGRLVRLRPGAEPVMARAHRELERAFPGWGVTLERFSRCYPLHPDTLAVLEGLRFLFSQQRGVVDFISRQLGGDEGSHISPWLLREYRDLLTPDRVYDHFRSRLNERVESSRLAQTVVPHYERAVEELFDSDADRELAMRAVKLLCLLSASPLERPRTASELAGMLLAEVSGLDPEANVSYLEKVILSPLVDRGAYVVATTDRPRRYTVQMEADAALVAASLINQARAELALGDRRLVQTLIELGSSPVLPLQLLSDVGIARRELLWQNTLRSMLVGTVRLAELTDDDAVELVTQARAAGAEGCILVGEPEPEAQGGDGPAMVDRARRMAGAAGRLAIWVPAMLHPEEQQILLDVHSRRLVGERARGEGRTELAEFVARGADADAARTRELLRRCYFGGDVVFPDPASAADLPSLAGLSFDRQLANLAEPLLNGLHPRHREVAPRRELVGERILRQLVNDVLTQGRIGQAAVERGQLRPLIEGYLAPLGLARRRRDAVIVAPDPTRSPAVAEALRLVGEGEPVSAVGVMQALADGPVGLSEPESLLVLNACVQAGLLEAWRGRRRLAEAFLALTPADRLGAGELVEASIRSAVAGLAPIPGTGPFEPWSSDVQRAAWDHARAWLETRHQEVAEVRVGLQYLDEVPALADAGAGPLVADVELVGAVVERCDPELAPPAGLRRLSEVIGDGAAVLAAAGRVGAVARFLREDLARLEREVDYLTHPELVLPQESAALAGLREEALARVGTVLELAAEDRAGSVFAASREFRSAYVAVYEEAHDRFYGAVRSQDIDQVRASPAYLALARLSAVGVFAVPDDQVKVDRALAAAAPARCTRRLDAELAWKPRCGCGYAFDWRPSSFDPAALVAVAQRGVGQHLAEWARPEHRSRLEEASSDLSALGRTELADELRQLLTLVAKPDQADLVSLSHLLAGDLTPVLGDVLAGSQLIVQRDLAELREDLIGRRYPKRRLLELIANWIDPLQDVPPGGFVEVVDSSDPGVASAGLPAAPLGGIGDPRGVPSMASDRGAAASRIPAAGTPAAGATAAFLAQRFPGLARLLPAPRAADGFWLAAWWADRRSPPAWLPPLLLAERQVLAVAAQAAVGDLSALAELSDLDSRIGPDSLLGDQVSAALDLRSQPAAGVAGVLCGERLLRHPVRLAGHELLHRLATDWQLTERLGDIDLGRLAEGHALVSEAEMAPLGHLLEAARHLAAIDRALTTVTCSELVSDLYPTHHARVAELLSRAELADVGGSLVASETIDGFRGSALRLLHAMDMTFRGHAQDGFPGCLKVWEIGQTVLAPLLGAHGRVGVLLVDGMRADLWHRLRQVLEQACPDRPLRQAWAVVPEPTRTAEAVAALYLGRPVPGGSVPAHPEADMVPFSHLGYQATALVGADRDHRAAELRALWSTGPPISVAVATGVDERLHRTSVEPAALLDDALVSLERRIVPSLAALAAEVPLVILADHGFRENPAWGRGPEGRYVHGGLSLEECVVPVAVLGAGGRRPR